MLQVEEGTLYPALQRMELEEEMRLHLEMKTAEMGDEPAARRQFGNITHLVEQSREAWGWPYFETWVRDIRHGFRLAAKRRGFSATVVLTLAIGIGATSTIFSLIDAVVLRALPYPGAERLMSLHETRLSSDRLASRVAPARLEDWQRLTRTFVALAGCDVETFAETTGLTPEQMHVASVSPRFFAVLAVAPLQGRVFSPEEERFGGPKTIVISEDLWQRRFAGSSVFGRSLRLEGQAYVVVGVMPRSVQYPSPWVDAWIPTQANAELMRDRGASARFYETIGRLKSDATLEQAQSDLNTVQRLLGYTYPTTDAGWGVVLEPLKERVVGNIRPTLWLLFGSVSLLLVIACANVGCLLLAQLNSRTEELATRCALGADRRTIARQLLAEGQVYSVLGAGLGILIAFLSLSVARQQLSDLPRIADANIDIRVLGFAATVSVVAALAFSLLPTLRLLERDLGPSLTRAGRGVIRGGQTFPRLLVSGQLAFATVLLVGAGLFLRSLLMLQETPLGFRPDHVLALRISASFSESPEAVVERHQRTMDVLSGLPNVRSVAISRGLPGAISVVPVEFRLDGEAADPTGAHFARRRIVTARYFQSVGIPLLAGETCRMDPGSTNENHEYEALVNQAFADRYVPARDPIGRQIIFGPQENRTAIKIVGVVDNAREEGYSQPLGAIVYACGYLRWFPDSDFLIQTDGDPATIARAAREAIHAIEPARAVYSVQPLTGALSATLLQHRFRTLLVSGFSIIALTLAAVGLYGVMTYIVSQRMREFGIRLAFGASRSAIAIEILRSAGVLAMSGGAIGLTLAALTSQLLGALITGVRPAGAAPYALAAGVLFGAALVACLNPGRRAMSVDPIEVLRN